jgi:vancomycin resistance protein YoaR
LLCVTDKSIPTDQARTGPDLHATGDADAPTAEFAAISVTKVTGNDETRAVAPDASHQDAGESAAPPPDESATPSAEPAASSVEPAAPSGEPAAAVQTPFWRRRWVVITAAAVGGLLLLYGIAFAIAGGNLARNATVLGVEVGGLTLAEAEAKLAGELPAIVDQPIDIEVPEVESTYSVVPSEAGLTIDYPATVGAVPGGSASPLSLLRAIVGGGPVDPVPAVDRSALVDSLSDIAAESDVEPVNGAIAFDGAEIVTSQAEVGLAVDVDATAGIAELIYFGGEGPYQVPLGPISATVAEVQPTVTDADVERAVAEFAEPAMSGPVTITAGEHTFDITPEMIGAALTMSADGTGTLTPELHADRLAEAAEDVLAEVGQPGRDATVRIEGGSPVVVPHEIGVGVAPGALADAIQPVLTVGGADRAASVEYSEVVPEFTAEDAEGLGVREVVGEYTTRFPHAAYRNTNIGLAASKINNTLLKPGDEFSLNGLVGERSEANGFAVGWVIESGRLQESVGGGVSQVATTTFHAAYLAGLEDVYHQPHSIYFDRYPIGAEATVSWGNFDMQFANDTPYGVLVETRFTPSSPSSQGVLTVRLWSTEHFEVETSVSGRSNPTSPPTVYDTSSDCQPEQGWNGFSITAYRQVRTPDGELDKDEAFPWTYRPNPTVVCGPKPGGDDG